jgi:hypothetical protein
VHMGRIASVHRRSPPLRGASGAQGPAALKVILSSEAQALVLGSVAIPLVRTCPLLLERLRRLSSLGLRRCSRAQSASIFVGPVAPRKLEDRPKMPYYTAPPATTPLPRLLATLWKV